MFKQPSAKRKNAETSEKSSTWWERTAAPMRHWKMPSAPMPKLDPRTGKNLSKNLYGHPTSDSIKIRTWKMMSKRFMTAQKAPAGWLGTVLLL